MYLTLALGAVPWLRLDRTGAAFVGAVGVVALGILTAGEAMAAQDVDTLLLLFSMMLIVSFLMNSGILGRVQEELLKRVRGPSGFLWAVIAVSGFGSAFFINDIICLVMAPMVIRMSRTLRLNPVPYLLATAMASNIGSLATPIGNPQNIYLASVGHIPFSHFVVRLFPISLAGLVLLGITLSVLFRGRWHGAAEESDPPDESGEPRSQIRAYVLIRTAAVLVALFAAFWFGLPMGTSAAAGAAFLLLTRRISRRRIFSLVDWDLLVLFAALFTLLAAAREAGVIDGVFGGLSFLRLDQTLPFSALTLLLSNLFSNVPAVLFLAQFIPNLPDPADTYLLAAMVSTLAGNLTLLGSIANLIVAEKARGQAEFGFWTYTRAGIPVTIGTLAFGLFYWWVIG